MNKTVLWSIVVIAILVVVGGYFLFPQGNQQSDQESQEGPESSGSIFSSKTTSKEVSELTIDLSDLPEGFTVAERTPRTQSDVSQIGIDLGWEEGYYIRFSKGESLFDISSIEQSISRYPVESIAEIVGITSDFDYDDYEIEELPSSDIGEKTAAWRFTDKELGLRSYTIEFYRKDIYMSISMSGTSTDYELLKELAREAASKI